MLPSENSLRLVDGASEPGVIRVVIADDHTLVRRGITSLLSREADIQIVDECADAEAAIETVARHRPDVLVLDLNMPGRPTLEALPDLRERFPETAVVILTIQAQPTYARRAIAAGAAAYVLKDGAEADLVAAIRATSRGGRYMNRRFATKLAVEEAVTRPGGLSLRQLQILRMLALGYTNGQISDELSLSIRTIETHRAHIMAKLDFTERHQLVQFAFAHGLIGRSTQ